MMNQLDKISEKLRAWYPFDDSTNPGKDASGNGMDAQAMGDQKPEIRDIHGRKAVAFTGGPNGSSYFKLPANILEGINDNTGFTISTWVSSGKILSVWERIFDFGKGMGNPYIFLTRNLRGVCFLHEDLAADAGKPGADNTWNHIVMTVTGTDGGKLSSAGPRIYLNGELVADGWISQTSSGTYKKYREFLQTLEDGNNYVENYIGRSQFPADPDYHGALADFRIYSSALDEEEILALMCESLDADQILKLAKDKYLEGPMKIVNDDMELPSSLLDGQVNVFWKSSRPDIVTSEGKVSVCKEPVGVLLTAVLTCGGSVTEKQFPISVIPKKMIPCEITIHGDREVLDISPTLFGLFYEDINHSADGGLYAEMIQNRSFEDFHFDTYDARSGENGVSTGRVRSPLKFWFGDIEHAWVHTEGGLRDHFGLKDQDASACFIELVKDSKLYNHGFCDDRLLCSMNFREGEGYEFSIWAKTQEEASVEVVLMDPEGNPVSNSVKISFESDGQWKKYWAEPLKADKTVLGKIELAFKGRVSIDMVSLMPQQVWGAAEEAVSETAHKNYQGNPNYRLRKDLVEALAEMHPTFLRFPGGCISEGSYIWDNVYDWKDSVGPVEVRKENFNVWGYTMTLGLGYMEYFQLSEDLHAEPLPVMACGVLCQARSDYANPAGGALQEKYIKNFTDLIDFAISTDFANNEWAALRKEMGHEAPFGLHYLGVGNENWGTEFFASFEAFKHAIDVHMEQNYPGYELHIISTVGAQADDTSYQLGWKFLAGYQKGKENIRFTDGKKSFEQEVSWYPHQKNYLETIVDEHYYRSNDYLLENVDRYNYYYRPYVNGVLDENQVSKVFVGEYASSDKNTLAGAIAEAAVMTGFERNSDVVRLAATAPLFNKVAADSSYRWTPDAIWFDDETVWRTPTYYVQQMFAKYIGTKLLDTTYELYSYGEKQELRPHGGITVKAAKGKVRLLRLKVSSKKTGEIFFEQDFDKELSPKLQKVNGTDDFEIYYINNPKWQDYTVELQAKKLEPSAEIAVGAGLCLKDFDDDSLNKASLMEYCVGKEGHGTGLRVIKDGKEGYTMGDYSSSVFAGNLRACYDEPVEPGIYTVTVDFGDTDSKKLRCFYEDAEGNQRALLESKLEYYIRDLYHSVTADDEHIYVKLVNADNYVKNCLLKLEGVKVLPEAEIITLTGPIEAAHAPNVNTRDMELVKPTVEKVKVLEDGLGVPAPANSLKVVVLKKDK